MRGAYFNFRDKDDPSYNPFGSTYTTRQEKILAEEIPLEEIRKNELAVLVQKAERMGDIANYEIAMELYDRKNAPPEYTPSYTQKEARDILQSLTPWKIEW